MTDAKRFHPVGDLLFCRLKPEKVRGSIHIPASAKVQVPIAEILECGPDVEKDVDPAARRYRPGVHVLVHLQTVTGIDGELFFVAAPKVLARVDPESVIQTLT